MTSSESAILFSRIRDRLSTLSALYGSGPLAIDFRAMGERAAEVRLTHCDIRPVTVERRSRYIVKVKNPGFEKRRRARFACWPG